MPSSFWLITCSRICIAVEAASCVGSRPHSIRIRRRNPARQRNRTFAGVQSRKFQPDIAGYAARLRALGRRSAGPRATRSPGRIQVIANIRPPPGSSGDFARIVGHQELGPFHRHRDRFGNSLSGPTATSRSRNRTTAPGTAPDRKLRPGPAPGSPPDLGQAGSPAASSQAARRAPPWGIWNTAARPLQKLPSPLRLVRQLSGQRHRGLLPRPQAAGSPAPTRPAPAARVRAGPKASSARSTSFSLKSVTWPLRIFRPDHLAPDHPGTGRNRDNRSRPTMPTFWPSSRSTASAVRFARAGEFGHAGHHLQFVGQLR